MHAVFDGGVFSGHPKSVPTDGVQYVMPSFAPISSQRVADGVVAHVPHMDTPAGIGEHAQYVLFGFGLFLFRLETVVLVPVILPLLFDFGRVVSHPFLRFVSSSFVIRSLPEFQTVPCSYIARSFSFSASLFFFSANFWRYFSTSKPINISSGEAMKMEL